jgi:hypothetical protein
MIARKRRELAALSLHQEEPPTDALVTQTPEASEETMFMDWPHRHGELLLLTDYYTTQWLPMSRPRDLRDPRTMYHVFNGDQPPRFGRVIFGRRMLRTGGLTSGPMVSLSGSAQCTGKMEEREL